MATPADGLAAILVPLQGPVPPLMQAMALWNCCNDWLRLCVFQSNLQPASHGDSQGLSFSRLDHS